MVLADEAATGVLAADAHAHGPSAGADVLRRCSMAEPHGCLIAETWTDGMDRVGDGGGGGWGGNRSTGHRQARQASLIAPVVWGNPRDVC